MDIFGWSLENLRSYQSYSCNPHKWFGFLHAGQSSGQEKYKIHDSFLYYFSPVKKIMAKVETFLLYFAAFFAFTILIPCGECGNKLCIITFFIHICSVISMPNLFYFEFLWSSFSKEMNNG